MAGEVEIDVFSGRPNPRWRLSSSEERELRRRILALKLEARYPHVPDLGFRGFIVRMEGLSATVYARTVAVSLSSGPRAIFSDTQGIEEMLRQEAGKRGYMKFVTTN